MLHITEHTGRGIPKIPEVYGKDSIHIKENNILVTIPYNRLGDEVYAPVNDKNTQVEVENTQVKISKKEIPSKIIEYCYEPKTMAELVEYLGFKERRAVIKYLNPLLEQGRIAMTIPDKSNSRFQKYVSIK